MVGPPLTGGAAILARLRAQKSERAKVTTGAVKEVTILYGSQTGTAQDIAMSIQADSLGHGVKSKVASCNEFGFGKVSSEKTPVMIFVVSSTGDGDPPDNCSTFFRDLKKEQTSDYLKGIQFTVLGLGDSNYTSFMHMPREFRRKCVDLGASLFYEYKEADEVDGLDDITESWVDGLWEPLKKTLRVEDTESKPQEPTKVTASISAETKIPESLDQLRIDNIAVEAFPSLPVKRIEMLVEDNPSISSTVSGKGDRISENSALHRKQENGSYSPQEPFWAEVSNARLMTAPWSDRRVLHVELDITGSGLEYHPGDSIGVLPENSKEMVDSLARRLSVSPDAVVSAAPTDGGSDQAVLAHIDFPCTVGHALTQRCDITSSPRKLLLRYLAEACTDAEEKNKMLYLCSRLGKDAYRTCILEGQLSLLDVLSYFPSCQPSLDYLLDLLPPLAPRHYSVTSCMDAHPGKVQFAFTLAKIKNATGTREGVATGWMNNLLRPFLEGNGDASLQLPIFVKSGGAFRIPERLDEPWILVGPGTGVAPFRGFLESRQACIQEHGGDAGESWLFFGCRKEDEDFLYKDDLHGFVTNGTLTKLELAFSRQEDTKVYVQNRMEANSEQLYELMVDKGAYVFVCGDGQEMARDVHNCLSSIIQKHGSMSKEAAGSKLIEMTQSRKYVRDVWS